jgi:hypothetical protein
MNSNPRISTPLSCRLLPPYFLFLSSGDFITYKFTEYVSDISLYTLPSLSALSLAMISTLTDFHFPFTFLVSSHAILF